MNHKEDFELKYKHIIFDFDGVLAETNDIRIQGFVALFGAFPQEQVRMLIEFISSNAGLSRYKKIEYFFKVIRRESISTNEIMKWAAKYSDLVKAAVIAAKPVEGSLTFLESYASEFDFAIISSSDQEEVRSICRHRAIDHYFTVILGSPTDKQINIENMVSIRKWSKKLCLYVGDTINDYRTAQASGIDFIGRESGVTDWKLMGTVVFINNLHQLHKTLISGVEK